MTPKRHGESSSPLLNHYERALEGSNFVADAAQIALLDQLDALRVDLEHHHSTTQAGGFSRWLRNFGGGQAQSLKGLYIWGGVGRGKTWLMDLFFDSLSFDNKKRVHFHRFMQSLQRELRTLTNVQNPLQTIGERIAEDNHVLCFDEFYVSDIGDAMLLAGLLDSLFTNGLVLVATSNTAPDNLYQDGLQRARFLPAIDLIKTHTKVIAFGDGEDYRMVHLGKLDVYHHPADAESDRKLAESFSALTNGSVATTTDVDILGRSIPARGNSEDVAWFEFEHICDGPRSASDYIEIARCYKTVIVSNVPLLTANDDNAARRFINMVDEFYDRGINLIISAATLPGSLYQGAKLSAAFERTTSRLIEMQSQAYLARGAKP